MPWPNLRPSHPFEGAPDAKLAALKNSPKIQFCSDFHNNYVFVIPDSPFIIFSCKINFSEIFNIFEYFLKRAWLEKIQNSKKIQIDI